ncbi:hypothetical protein H0N96_00455 [Candidatus Micrarchaeota archaeon]|nr:hypothetical protein [Candidatus Micrarchaeota archaeon]
MPIRVRLPIKLHEMTPAFRKHLIKLVEESGGKVAVLVHPFYNEQEFASYPHQNVFMEPPSKRVKDTKKIRDYYSSLVRFSKSKKLPLAIVFEGHDEIGKTHARLVKHYPEKDWVYVPTEPGHGRLLHNTSWERVLSILEDLGVKRVFLAGAYFSFAPPSIFLSPSEEKEKKIYCTKCVGAVYQNLGKSTSFKVELLPKTILGNAEAYLNLDYPPRKKL